MRRHLRVSGKTTDGKIVVQGIFKISSSLTGLPLDIILQQLDGNNMIVDWVDFYEESIRGGWKEKTSINRIETAVGDYYGPVHKNEIISRLRSYIAYTHRK